MSGTGGVKYGVSATELKGIGGNEGEGKGSSDENGREMRLEKLRQTNYREYWRKGGRGPNPNRASYDDKGGKEGHAEIRGDATKQGDGERRKERSVEVDILKVAAKQLGSKTGPAEKKTEAEQKAETKRTREGSNKVSWGDREEHDDDEEDEGTVRGTGGKRSEKNRRRLSTLRARKR